MAELIKITLIVEDTVNRAGLIAEHGLAFLLEYKSKYILFDTGQGLAIAHNAKHLDLPIEKVDTVILSHGHYDHTGGLSYVLEKSPNVKILSHPLAFENKYVCKNQTFQSIGMPQNIKDTIHKQNNHIIFNAEPIEIYDGLYVTGQIPRITDFEDTGGYFFVDEQCQQSDSLLDDQALYFESSQGIVVVLGCAHSGIINTLKYISHLTNRKHIYSVIGGMHLLSASKERIARTICEMKKFDIQYIYPMHCTGMQAILSLCLEFKTKCHQLDSGASIVIGQF